MLLSQSGVTSAFNSSYSKYFGLDVIWSLDVHFGAKGMFHGVIKWKSYKLTPCTCLNAQNLLLHWWGEDIVFKLSTLKENDYRKADTLLRLLVLCQKFYPSQKLSELTKQELTNLAVMALFHVWDDLDDKSRRLRTIQYPLSKQSLERLICVLKSWHESYQLGFVSDGPEYLMSKPIIEKQLRQEFKRLDVCFDSWKKGGTYGPIPFVIAHLLLADALKILESESTKQLLIFFDTVREREAIPLMNAFWHHENIKRLIRKNHNPYFERKVRGRTANSPIEREIQAFSAELLKRLSFSSADTSTPIFPWNNFIEFRQSYVKTQIAIYVIFLSIMGKRGPSEIATLRAIDISPSNALIGSNATMRPSIEKTNLGLREEQGVSNFIDQSFNTLLRMGYVDKSGTDYPLFSLLTKRVNTTSPPTPISQAHLSFNLQDYYIKFIERSKAQVDFDILELHSRLSSHQFRHSFAEFGLRRFDGNVEELLRQHFCHRKNHWWIKRYTEDKLDKKRIEQMNRSYIRELVPRILQDNPDTPDFVGAMALFIKKNIAERIKVLSPEQVESYLEECCSDFIQVTPHEYGWCLLHQKYRSVAQCADTSGIPKPDNTTSSKCNSCMNFCSSRSSHLEKQTQIALSHIDFLEQSTWKMPALKEASVNAVLNAQKLFPELKRLGSVK